MIYPAYWPDYTVVYLVLGGGALFIFLLLVLTDKRFSIVLKAIALLMVSLVGVVLAPFSTRSYEITDDKLIIHRLGLAREIKRVDIVDTQVSPNAMDRSERLWRLSDILRLQVHFRNSYLGEYQAYLSWPTNLVVIRGIDFVYVVSPVAADSFARDLMLPAWREG